MTRILAHSYNAVPSDCRASFVKREAQARNNVTVCFNILSCRSFKNPCNKAAASESPRRTAEYVEGFERRENAVAGGKLLLSAEVVKWQTRTFEGRVAQAVRVQVPPSAPNLACSYPAPR